jgi:UDPglucose 6-dehydrogenase
MKYNISNICCIGAGYVGGPTMSVFADKCPKLKFNVVDINKEKIKAWNSDDLNKLPVYEPGLDEVIKRCRNKNLFFSTEIKENIAQADMIFISVNTPTKKKGIGAGKASDLKFVEACAREVAKYATNHTIVVEKSTLPVRTAEVIKTILLEAEVNLEKKIAKPTFEVLSNPEFLSEGTAVEDLNNPDRVLIGGESKSAILELSKIYKNWVPENKILQTNIWSSELAKLTANAFLAQRISSINSIAALCEATGGDVREVARAIGTDKRIGPRFLDSGPGFGGSCFKKDILNLVYLSNHFGLPEVANFWEGVVHMNTWHQKRISKLIVKKLFGTLAKKKITILGFAFKANTNDTRESASIQICKDLIDEGAELFIHDPIVSPKQIKIDLEIIEKKDEVSIFVGELNDGDCFEEIFKDSHAIVILTEWKEYTKLEWQEISKIMKKPAWIFDARSILEPQQVLDAGLQFWRIGDGI